MDDIHETLTGRLRMKITPSMLRSIDSLADDLGMNRSEIIRVAVKLLIKFRGRLTDEQIHTLL